MGNIALNGNMTASNYIAPFTASRTVNGSIAATSRWVGEVSSAAPASIVLSLNANAFVNRWIVRHMSALTGWPAPYYSMSDYALQGSLDGTTWYTIDSVSNNIASVTDRTFASVYYRFYRVYVTKGLNNNNKIASIMEFELYTAPPTSQYLSALTINSGTLTPVFNKNTYAYTASVGYDVSSITVTPTAEVPTYLGQNATITVNGVPVASGTASAAIPLTVGTNTINIDVTSAIGGAAQRYVLTVTRAESNYLTGLVLMNGTTAIPLNTTFVKTTTSYTASVGYDVTSLTVTATKESANATITINGTAATSGVPFTVNSLAVGSNNIVVAVTTPGMPVQNYTVVVTKVEDLCLSALKIGPNVKVSIALTPSFDKNTTAYTGSTAALTSLLVTSTADVPGNVNLTVNGNPATSGTAISVSVTPGQINPINIVVTSKSTGATKTYTCSISVSN